MKQGYFFVAISAIIVLIAAVSFIAAIFVWRGFLNLFFWGFALLGSISIFGESIKELKQPTL